ncbi:MAG: hypothetical protein ACE5NM_05765 [Sedimentisphaerales bacterium]
MKIGNGPGGSEQRYCRDNRPIAAIAKGGRNCWLWRKRYARLLVVSAGKVEVSAQLALLRIDGDRLTAETAENAEMKKN